MDAAQVFHQPGQAAYWAAKAAWAAYHPYKIFMITNK